MKLGFASLAAIDRSLRDLAAILRRSGYDGIELRGKDRQHLDPAMSAAERAEAVRVLKDAGIEAAAVTSYVRIAEATADPKAGAATLRQYIDLARDVGAPLMRVFGGQVPAGQPREDVEKRMGDLLVSVAGAAQAAGVSICLETHDSFCRGRDVARVLAHAAHPAVVALWDVDNQCRTGESAREALDALWPRIGYLHVKDSFPLPDGKRQLCFMGAGDVPVAEVIGILKGRGFGGYLVVEWEKAWHPELADAEVAAPQHSLKLREYLAR